MKVINIVEFALVFQAEASLGHDNPAVIAKDIERLRKLAMELERLNLNACNRGLSYRQESRRGNVGEGITNICFKYGITAVMQGDPRGAAFGILCKKTNRYNSWGGVESGFRLMFEGK